VFHSDKRAECKYTRADPQSPIISVSLVLVIWPWGLLVDRLTRLARFCHAACRTWQVAGLWHRIVTRARIIIETPHYYSSRPDPRPNSFPCPLFILRGMTVDSIGRKSSRFRVGNTAVNSSSFGFGKDSSNVRSSVMNCMAAVKRAPGRRINVSEVSTTAEVVGLVSGFGVACMMPWMHLLDSQLHASPFQPASLHG
jgi:hypothetical protein